ncbi:MAG: GGDEF domain-containing protein [Bacillota bacterium]
MDFREEDHSILNAQSDGRAAFRAGEFADSRLEEEYFELEVDEALGYVRRLVPVLAVIYLLFLIPDFLLNSSLAARWFIAINRLVVAAVVFAFYARISSSEQKTDVGVWFSALEVFVGISFVLIFFQYEAPDLLVHALGAIVLIMIIFIMPNRWVNRVAIASGLALAFVAAAGVHRADFVAGEFAASAVYLAVIILLNAVSSYRLGVARRREFLARKELFRAATLDSLTGVFNRNKFNEDLDTAIRRARRYGFPLSLSIFDLDDFKGVNDRLGHLEGDRILCRMATSVRDAVRDTDIFARWGGDEFVILMPHTDPAGGVRVLGRVRQVLSEEVGLTCSFGLATLRDGEDREDFLQRADRRLYSAKDAGRGSLAGGVSLMGLEETPGEG